MLRKPLLDATSKGASQRQVIRGLIGTTEKEMIHTDAPSSFEDGNESVNGQLVAKEVKEIEGKCS
jgi:hypothetical protein